MQKIIGNVKKNRTFGGLAQLGEHLPCKQGVASSSLAISITQLKVDCAHLEN